jgi:hypothetical protein
LFSSCLLSKAKARCCSRIMAEINSATTTPQKLIRCNRQPIKPQSIHWGMWQHVPTPSCILQVRRLTPWARIQSPGQAQDRGNTALKAPFSDLGPRPTFWIHNGLMSLMHKAQWCTFWDSSHYSCGFRLGKWPLIISDSIRPPNGQLGIRHEGPCCVDLRRPKDYPKILSACTSTADTSAEPSWYRSLGHCKFCAFVQHKEIPNVF